MVFSALFQIKRDSKMSLSDKISWIGGMLGLFTGFSVISFLEILYWLTFKVILHKDEIEPEQEDLQKKVNKMEDEQKNSDEKIKTLEVLLEEILITKFNTYFYLLE